MTVQEICGLFVHNRLQTINLWSDTTEDIVWTGTANEVFDREYADMEVSSIDNLTNDSDVLTINIFDDIAGEEEQHEHDL